MSSLTSKRPADAISVSSNRGYCLVSQADQTCLYLLRSECSPGFLSPPPPPPPLAAAAAHGDIFSMPPNTLP